MTSSDGVCSPDRHSSDVKSLLPVMCSLLRGAGRRRVPPNMPAHSSIARYSRWGGSKCSLAVGAVAAGGVTVAVVVGVDVVAVDVAVDVVG
mgnify:CR=1 FL=1